MAQVAANVPGGFEALGVEAVGVDLIATMVAVPLIDGPSRLLVEGTRLSEVLAEEVAPFGSQTATRQFVNLYPLAVFEAAFGHHQACPEQSRRVDLGFEAQVAASGVDGVD